MSLWYNILEFWTHGLRERDVTAGFYQAMLFIYKWSRLRQKKMQSPRFTMKWENNLVHHFCFLGEERFSVEYKFQNVRLDHCTHSASMAFLGLGEKATHGTKKRFFSMFTIKSFLYLYVCTQYRFALQVQKLQVFWHWCLPQNSPKPLHLKSLLSFRWGKIIFLWLWLCYCCCFSHRCFQTSLGLGILFLNLSDKNTVK